ncbi:hypothetical protein WA1_48245 [Scytonema hofmannii PCC 7110]|uniref:Uncharacterized protein n=1 Tax=Scytonema hofmannii PCC 7110 TaxID=128403 RepID=A0A139WY74_9CYAN|nr:hypothetical protein [Scytonema hofmannii]KYC37399.1 hypothetical protein WA1_48245 [Scytonema hofmannii PCC 7110]
MTELCSITPLAMETLPLILIAIGIVLLAMLIHEIYQQKQTKSQAVTISKSVIPPKTVTVHKPSLAVPPTQLPSQLPIALQKVAPVPPVTAKTVSKKEVPEQKIAPVLPVTNDPGLTPWPTAIPHNKRTRELFGQLVKLVHGDSNTANRLVSNQRTKNPGRSEEWILEKVMDDLTRDRH